MKKLVLLLTVATILLIGTFTVSAQENQLNVEVNGETIEFTNDSGKPFVDSNYRTQIPVRIVLEKLGINVTWDSIISEEEISSYRDAITSLKDFEEIREEYFDAKHVLKTLLHAGRLTEVEYEEKILHINNIYIME